MMDGTLIEKIGGCKRIIAVGTTAVVLGMVAVGKSVPSDVLNVWLLVVGTYYGQSIANGKK